MNSEPNWVAKSLGELIDIKHGFAFKSKFFRGEPPGDVLLTPGNFAIGGGFKRDKLKYYDGPVPDEYILREGDLIITMTDLSKAGDTLGYPALVPKPPAGVEYLHNQRLGKVEVLPNVPVDMDFLYYLLQTKPYRYEVLATATGTTVRHTSPTRIKDFEFSLPPLGEQKAIAHILSTLDNKIEINRQMNHTLEAIARAIFKSWFVDFDPVWAKANGEQPYGMDAETAALFPNAFVDSELGQIPEGWGTCLLDDLVELIGGGTPKTSVPEYWDGDVPWFSVKDAPVKSDVFVIDTERKITLAGVDNSSAAILPVGTTIISARGTVGKLALIGTPMAMNQSCYGVRGRSNYPDFFTFFHLRAAVSILQQHTHGSVFDTITRSTFKTIEAVAPPVEVARAYDDLVDPMLECIRTNLLENQTLTELRDTLLPKLISGELRVPEVEEEIEEVA